MTTYFAREARASAARDFCRTLKGIKRTAHAIYESYYSDDLDFANY